MENASILIVDDEKAIVDMIKRVLEKEGYRNLLDAASAEEAIPVVKANKVDLIVLDVMMGGMSGFEACTLIREYSDAPIFFLTARSSDADKLSGFAVGADDYITKPFNPLELAARIRAHLKRTYQSKETNSNQTYTYDYFTFSPQNAELIVGGKPLLVQLSFCSFCSIFVNTPMWCFPKIKFMKKFGAILLTATTTPSWFISASSGKKLSVIQAIRSIL